jgi:hypothetical protein
MMKACTKCKEDKPLDAFRFQKTGRNGLHASCKSCESLYRKKRRNGPDRDAILAREREIVADYRKQNPEKCLEAKRKYYASEKGKASKQREDAAYKLSGGRRASDLRRAQKPLSDARLEARLRYQHKKRASMKSMGELDKFVLAEAVRLMRLRKKITKTSWHVDHITPVSRGGPTTHDNLQVVPALWNRQKSNKHQQRFFAA